MSLRGSDYVDSISSRDERSSETVGETGGSPHNPALFIMDPTGINITLARLAGTWQVVEVDNMYPM